ncbi:MAG: helix-turn-helix domain-containing protein [Propionibacteriaceae bacterium]|nr:helix-turn-helix domain-containing protein [Propionibacteriaceae bacterium]
MDTARRRATRARLVEAAIVEFGRNGIDATSVEQLCEAAGFTRGAFYSNFTSKDDLCIEIARQTAEETAAYFRQVLERMPHEIEPMGIVPALLDVANFSNELHATQMEMMLRAARNPEFGERLRAARADVMPLYVEVAVTEAARAGMRYSVPVADALEIIEALHYSPNQIGYTNRSRHLIGLVSQHLMEPIAKPEEKPQ